MRLADSSSDLTLVIGQLDRKLNISEPPPEASDKADKSRTQPQSDDDDGGGGVATEVAADTARAQVDKDNAATAPTTFSAGRSLSRSSSSSNNDDEDEEEEDRTVSGRGSCVLERAAMEIIDSEASYVVDLQQVIEGYLHDWKERACLKLDELETLFGNIEQLYEVNEQLSARLKETHGDVALIAQCFLDFNHEERFGVYTTYW